MNAKKIAIVWLVISFLVAFVFIFFVSNGVAVLRANFFMKLLAVIVGTFTGFLGAMLGDVIRRFAMPDSIFTNGGMASIIGTKLFWLFGPQLIGLFFGMAMGSGFILS